MGCHEQGDRHQSHAQWAPSQNHGPCFPASWKEQLEGGEKAALRLNSITAQQALRRLLWLSPAPGFNPLEGWSALAAPLFPDPTARVSLHL